MKFLIAGSDGQLGSALAGRLGESCVAYNRRALDITDRIQVQVVLNKLRPDCVINCAAYRRADAAETDAEACWRTNVTGVEYLAEICGQLKACLVHVSSDYVFGEDQARTVPYLESDRAGPLNVYGHSKLASEKAAARCEKHFIIRTCGLYGRTCRSSNFVEKILLLARTQPQLRVVNDQRCSPTYVEHVVDAILYLASTTAYGLYHVVDAASVTWFEFALEILRLGRISTQAEPIRSSEFGAAAKRPHFSVLDCSKYHSLGGPVLGDWRDSLASFMTSEHSPIR